MLSAQTGTLVDSSLIFKLDSTESIESCLFLTRPILVLINNDQQINMTFWNIFVGLILSQKSENKDDVYDGNYEFDCLDFIQLGKIYG